MFANGELCKPTRAEVVADEEPALSAGDSNLGQAVADTFGLIGQCTAVRYASVGKGGVCGSKAREGEFGGLGSAAQMVVKFGRNVTREACGHGGGEAGVGPPVALADVGRCFVGQADGCDGMGTKQIRRAGEENRGGQLDAHGKPAVEDKRDVVATDAKGVIAVDRPEGVGVGDQTPRQL